MKNDKYQQKDPARIAVIVLTVLILIALIVVLYLYST